MMTPTRLGIELAMRPRISMSAAESLSPAGRGYWLPQWFAASRPPELAVVELPVEPVAVADDALLHGDVEVGLVERDARHLIEGDLDEALDQLLVALGVRSEARLVDQLVER